MRAFIFDEVTKGEIAQIVERAAIEIIEPDSLNQPKSIQPVFGGPQFENLRSVDFLILEITESNPEVNFLLAQAILQQKPTLCVYKKNREPRDLLNYLIQRGTPKCITAHAYFRGSLSKVINRFLASVAELPQEIDELPSIKFTLRLTPKVDRYLDWKSKKMHRTKADLLRDWLRLKMDEDVDFQKRLRK